MDGQREHHDLSVCREGGYDKAVEGIQEASAPGFPRHHQYTLSTAPIPTASASSSTNMMKLASRDDALSRYSYDKAPDQKHFLGAARTRRLFRGILSNRKKTWQFNMSPCSSIPMGKRDYACTPLGHADIQHLRMAEALLSLTRRLRRHFLPSSWNRPAGKTTDGSGNPKWRNCMVHSGYEATSVKTSSVRSEEFSMPPRRRSSRHIPTPAR